MVVPYSGENPWLSEPLFLRACDCPPPRSLARGADETGDPLPHAKPPTIDDSVTAFLRTLSGANTSQSTITAYRTDLSQFARFLTETDCTVATPADITRTDVSIEAARAERADGLIQPSTDPCCLRRGVPRVDTQRGDQVVDGAGRHPGDVGLDHHRRQRLVDPPAGLEDAREERTLARLRDAQLDVTGLGRHQTWPGAVAFGDTGVDAFIITGPVGRVETAESTRLTVTARVSVRRRRRPPGARR